MQTRTVGYVRIATTEADKARELLASVERTLRDYARERSWDVIEIYHDTGEQRAGFQRMLSSAHRADVVLIHESGAATVGGYSLSREVQDMGMTCLDINAQLDRKKAFVERLSRGRKRGARAGRHTAGKIPYGYVKADDGGLEIDVQEAKVVREIFREYLNLRSTSRVARLLGDEGRKTRRGNAFSRASISFMLKNETYIGRVRYGDIKARGQHPPIISAIVFNKVQKLLQSNRKSGRHRALNRSGSYPSLEPIEPS